MNARAHSPRSIPSTRSSPSSRPSPDGALFELSGVRLARAGRTVLDGVDLVLRPQTTALLGPSGSGKSTLLRLLNRLADPDEGSVRFHGRDVRELDPLELRRRVALVPQLPAPVEGTVADNVRYGPALAGRTVEVVRPLELAGLGPAFADRDASKLSVGEGQRLMLARALALEPEVLLLDEPTAALDAEARDAVERALAALSGVAMVLVTHERAQAERLAGRVVEIREGRVA